MKRHRWNGKITRKVRYVTCKDCGLIKETQPVPSGYVYMHPDRPDDLLFSAGECIPHTH